MGLLRNVTFVFDETMSGFAAMGVTDPEAGEAAGREHVTPIQFTVQARMPDFQDFLEDERHMGLLTGSVTWAPLGGTFPISDGRIHMFDLDPDNGERRMLYAFGFQAADGQHYYLHGQKHLKADETNVLWDITHLYTTLHQGTDETGPVVGAGILQFLLKDSGSLASSMRVEGNATILQRLAAHAAFLSLAMGQIRDEYIEGWTPLYDAGYFNLVLSGVTKDAANADRPFFLVAGTHEKGFPWGDGEQFSDVLLLVGDGAGGWRRLAASARALEGLGLDLAAGTCTFKGTLHEVAPGQSASFKAMEAGDPALPPRHVEFDLAFRAVEFDAVEFPFPIVPNVARQLTSGLASALRQVLPETHPLGITITPQLVSVSSGTFRIQGSGGDDTFVVDPTNTRGEAERGTFRSLKEPTLLYRYLCAIPPGKGIVRTQIHTGVLRDDREHWAKDRLDAWLGELIDWSSSSEYAMEGSSTKVRLLGTAEEGGAPAFEVLGDPVLEVANDHYPTGVFLRRIRRVKDAAGVETLALEEAMDLLRREPVGTTREAVVAVATGADRMASLDRALDDSGFDASVDAACQASGKAKAAFRIVIKPNFMFSYSREDVSTFTNPKLVGRLVNRLQARGYVNLAIVEAHSTYGEFFEHRSVREVAAYQGFDAIGIPIVDMTLDADEMRPLGQHLGIHPVSKAWREADYRISFAKNKSHCYAYYTLTLKNIYGALPLANKFKEYHCGRGIFESAIEYLQAFPVQFGIIDAYDSADGPFGVFASTAPRQTNTIIAGPDLVAVDWVGATKMGLDPMVSRYMKLAVNVFGKPRIRLIGDPTPYRPWLNVPALLALFTNNELDAHYHFGNVFYTACSQMDPAAFPDKPGAPWKKMLRRLSLPLRQTFFVQTGQNPTWANRLAARVLFHMGF